MARASWCAGRAIHFWDIHMQENRPTIVIVHGAWGGSWAFRRVDRLLREKGFDVYRPSLTGLGERVHLGSPDVGLGTHIEDVLNAIVFEDLRDIVLVGHSYGGMVITGVADRMPDRIRKLIYLDAYVPRDGENVMDNSTDPRLPKIPIVVRDGFAVPPWLDGQSGPRDVPQPMKTFTEPIVLRAAAEKTIPAAYILMVETGQTAENAYFASGAERAKQYGWRVIQMAGDHNPQHNAPQALADILATEAG
jgi:pimeloyl-ACP methyl ester carboxylesterase